MAGTATVVRMTPPSDGAMRLEMVPTPGDGGEVLPQRQAAVTRGRGPLPEPGTPTTASAPMALSTYRLMA